ncbi:hypothetical protein [Mucilaginibacter psychrotolerans]|nr:hypothetical protein [Mucilaginibacter psychrotolerans]
MSFLLLVAVSMTDRTCDALNYYRINRDFLGDIDAQFLAVGLFAGGVAVYYLITRLFKWDNEIFKYAYWGLLPLLVFHGAILTVSHNLKVGATERSICNKTTRAKKSGGMVSTNLTLKEYLYLQPNRREFPNLPPTSKNITIWFNGGDFIGDYTLQLTFTCSVKETIGKNERWTVKNINKAVGTKTVSYLDFDR